MTIKNVIKNTVLSLLALGIASCEGIYDDRSDCVNGIQLKFLFDYHMEPGANAFAANVDCITVYVFDNNGSYLSQYTETTAQLMDDHYRMVLPLAEGNYRLLVYGGLSCENPTFEIFEPWTGTPYNAGRAEAHHDNIIVRLPDIDGVSNKLLHDVENRHGGLFYGFQYRNASTDFDENGRKTWRYNSANESRTMEISVTNKDYGTTYTEYEVNMMKDTNNIRVILQELSGPFTVDHEDYEFTIIDDNFTLDSSNLPVKTPEGIATPVYRPHTRDNLIMGYAESGGREGTLIDHDEETPVQVAAVDFSTSRLHLSNFNNAKLIVTSTREHNDDGTPKQIIELPLINYLAATRGFGSNWIHSDQEFLDRQSNWTLYFFLQSGRWVSATIAVNDWIVRIDNIEL